MYHSQINKDNYHQAHHAPTLKKSSLITAKTRPTSTASMYSRAAYRPVLALRNQTAQRFTIMKIWKALRRFMSSHSRKRSVLKFKEPTNLLNSRQSTTSTSNKAYYTANNSSKAKRPFKRKSLLRIQESSDPTTSILTLIFQPYLIHSKDIESPRNAEPKCATG